MNEKYDLMTRNLKEIIGTKEDIIDVLNKEQYRIYWGTAPTGRIHLGYFVPLLKIADFLEAGCQVTILLADIHAYLDNMKSSLEQLEKRTQYYELMLKCVLKTLNVNVDQLKFIKGSEYQLTKEYTMDVYKLNSITTLSQAKHAGAEVVKQSDNPTMNGLLYPSLQALDEHYLNVHAQLGGIDQRKIFSFSRDHMPKLGYNKITYFLNEMVPGLSFTKRESLDDFSSKMSSSNEQTKIDLLDNLVTLKNKIKKVYCYPGDIEDNTLMTMVEKIIFPVLKRKGKTFIIPRKEKFGGNIEYDNVETLKNDFLNQSLHPQDFKNGVVEMMNLILEPIQSFFENNMELVKLAYN